MSTDSELVIEVRKGSHVAFAELVTRHRKLLMRVALRMTRELSLAEDIVQESFIKAYQRISLFEGRSSFRSWLYQITLNTAKNRLRSLKREPINIENLVVGVSSQAEAKMMEIDIRGIIRSEIEHLPTRQKQALSLRVFDDLSFKEIANVMDCPYDTAKANYRHALLKLKSRLEQNPALRNWSDSETHLLNVFNPSMVEVDG